MLFPYIKWLIKTLGYDEIMYFNTFRVIYLNTLLAYILSKNKTFVQRWSNVFNVGSTLYKCYTNVLCLLTMHSSGTFIRGGSIILKKGSQLGKCLVLGHWSSIVQGAQYLAYLVIPHTIYSYLCK